jgi:hypothetical protein
MGRKRNGYYMETPHNAETLHPMEIKQLSGMRNYHVMRSFHVKSRLPVRHRGAAAQSSGIRAWPTRQIPLLAVISVRVAGRAADGLGGGAAG